MRSKEGTQNENVDAPAAFVIAKSPKQRISIPKMTAKALFVTPSASFTSGRKRRLGCLFQGPKGETASGAGMAC
jgi:hypothetical protein